MMILMENSAAGTYEEMQSISCAFAVMAVLFLAAGTASFFINKIYHSINVILYFLKRSGEKRNHVRERRGKWCVLLMAAALIGLCASGKTVHGADSGQVPDAGESEIQENLPEYDSEEDLDIPALYVQTEAEFIKKGESGELLLTGGKDGIITLLLAEEKYLSGSGEESGDLYINIDEEGKRSSISYDWEALIPEGEGLWSVDIPMERKKDREIRYQIVFAYHDSAGHGLQAGDQSLGSFGRLKDGCFESAWFVVDGRSPFMEEEITLQGKEGSGKETGGILVEPDSVMGEIKILESNPDRSSIFLAAAPLDQRAGKTVRESEHILPDGTLDIPAFTMDQEEDEVIIRFQFREEGRWQLFFSIADQAGNEGSTGKGQARAVSKEFMIDHTPPSLSIAYSPEVSIFRKRLCPEDVQESCAKQLARVNVKDAQVVFSGNQEVLVQIKDNYFDQNKVKIRLIKELWKYQGQEEGEDSGKAKVYGYWDQELISNPDSILDITKWDEIEEGTYLARLRLKKEGNYRLLIQYKDTAGMDLIPDNTGMENCDLFLAEGVYRGPAITVDRSAPDFLSALCLTQAGQTAAPAGEKGQYFKEKPTISLRISEENFCGGRLMLRDQVIYADGSESQSSDLGSNPESGTRISWRRLGGPEDCVYEAQIPIVQEGKHKISLRYVDLAGHSSDGKELHFTYDCQGPVVSCERVTDRQGKAVDLIQKDGTAVFLKDRIRVGVQVRDDVSGVEGLWYRFSGTYCDDGGKEYSLVPEYRKLSPEPEAGDHPGSYTFWLETEEDNFIGRLELYCRDGAGNYSNLVKSRQLTAETDQFHETKSHIEWNISGASSLNEEDRIMYFRDNAGIKVRFRDNWSGIKAWAVVASKKVLSVTDILKSCKELKRNTTVKDLEREVVIDAENYSDSSPDRPLMLYAAFIDNAGHYKLAVYEDYRIVMDQKKPMVEVAYNLKRSRTHGLYFNRARTAKITVTDMNFNPESVDWQIRGPGGGWEIGSWIREGNRSSCEISFLKDGRGYRLSLKGSDYAGNTFSWDGDKEFVIDQTAPEITLVMDQGRKGRSGKYYSEDKTMWIRIREENLREQDLMIKNRGAEGGQDGKAAFVRSSLGKKGAYYYVKITASEDGIYSPEVSCTDLAGNKSAIVTAPEIVIDKTAPVITFDGVRNGETFVKPVSFKAGCVDRNIDLESLEFHISALSGKEVADERLLTDLRVDYVNDSPCKVVKSWKDSKELRLKDGVYRLSVKGKDLAGNKAAGKTGLLFSVNREGASYILTQDFQERIADGYLRGRKDLVIREYSVNPTLTQIKIIRENQDQYVLAAEDYREKTEIVPAGSGAWSGWVKKTLCLPAGLFEQEGAYKILIKTKAFDSTGGGRRVVNQTDNEIKGKQLSFIVDRTPPQVRLGGLDQKIYEEKEHIFRLTVMDNVALDRVELTVEKGIFRKRKEVRIIVPKDLDKMNSILLKLKAYGGYQMIRYDAWDEAGNHLNSDYCSDSRSCLVAGIAGRQNASSGKTDALTAMEGQGDSEKLQQAEKRMKYLPGIFVTLFVVFLLAGGFWIWRDKKNMRMKEG